MADRKVTVIDNLTSSSSAAALSANQGKELKGQVDALAPGAAAGATALQPGGSGATLTGITASQVGAATAAQGAKADTALQPGSVVDTLTSTSTTAPLSANQGKVLKGQVDALAPGAAAGATALQPGGSGATLTGITASQVGAATAAQGAKADTALQPGSVVDNLTSTSTTAPLSANQGKALKAQVDALAPGAAAGATALQPGGSGATLTGITASQVGAATAAQGTKADTALQPDSVVDNLTSTSTTAPLSANQGKVLKGQVDALAPSAAAGATALQPGGSGANLTGITAAQVGALVINVTQAPYNADRSGAIDCTAALISALNAAGSAGGGTVYLPRGVYKFTPPLSLQANIKLVGDGFATDDGGSNSSATVLSVASTYDGPAIVIGSGNAIQYGNGIQDLAIRLNDKARGGVFLNAASSGYYRNVFVLGCNTGSAPLYAQYAYNLSTTASTGANINTMFNTFVNVKGGMVNTIIKMGYNHYGNVCHNSFVNVGGSYYVDGLDLVGSDNNNFSMTYLFNRPGATGYGVRITHGEANDSCYFFHLQSGSGMYVGANASAVVFGYDQTNGQPDPVLEDGSAALSWTTDSRFSDGWHLAGNLNLSPTSKLTDGTVSKTLAELVAATSAALATIAAAGVVKPDGTSIVIDEDGTIHAPNTGAGSVTSVATGTGLTGGPITGSGTIALADTAVTPGSYTSANITVDQQGRITSAGNGTSVAPAGSVSGAVQTRSADGISLSADDTVTIDATNHSVGVGGGAGTNSKLFIAQTSSDPAKNFKIRSINGVAGFYGQNAGGGTVASPTATVTNSGLLQLSAGGFNGSVWIDVAGQIKAFSGSYSAWSTASNPTRWDVQTTPDNSTALQTIARFGSNGSLGIGNVPNPVPATLYVKGVNTPARIGAAYTGSGLNDFTLQSSGYSGPGGDYYTVAIDGTGTPNTFKWSKNGGAYTTGVAITGGVQTLSDGVQVKWTATVGHTINDQWVMTFPWLRRTDDASGNPVEVVTGNGSVLIGTATSNGTSKLQVNGDVSATTYNGFALGTAAYTNSTSYLAANATAADSAKLNGQDASFYLAANATAADASKLGGQLPSYYATAASVPNLASPGAIGGTSPAAITGTSVKAQQFVETPNSSTSASVSGAVAPDCVTATFYAYALTGATTITLPSTGIPAGLVTVTFSVVGAQTLAFGGTYAMMGGALQQPVATKETWYTATTRNQGAKWFVFNSGVEQ